MYDNIIAKNIEDNYQNLLTDFKKLLSEIDIAALETTIVMLFDEIFNRLIENYSYENRIMKTTKNNIYVEHIEDHNFLTTTCMKLFRDKTSHSKGNHKLIKSFLNQVIEHHNKYDKRLMKEDTNIHNFNVQDKNYGCILFIVCEYGYFIKVYGEISEELLSEMVVKARAYRDELYYTEVPWGEIIDFRKWDLLTHNSMNMAKSNTTNAITRNKKFTIYVTGNSQINEFIVRSIEKESTVESFNVIDLNEAVGVLDKQNLWLGKVIQFDYVGNTNCIK